MDTPRPGIRRPQATRTWIPSSIEVAAFVFMLVSC